MVVSRLCWYQTAPDEVSFALNQHEFLQLEHSPPPRVWAWSWTGCELGHRTLRGTRWLSALVTGRSVSVAHSDSSFTGTPARGGTGTGTWLCPCGDRTLPAISTRLRGTEEEVPPPPTSPEWAANDIMTQGERSRQDEMHLVCHWRGGGRGHLVFHLSYHIDNYTFRRLS